jgi:DNA polymerase III gamma/tau subunit
VNNAALERLASVSERVQARPAVSALEKAPAKKEAYRWKATNPVAEVKEVATPKALKKALEHEKTPELAAKLAAEAIERDPWAAEVSQLAAEAGGAGGAECWKSRMATWFACICVPRSDTSIPAARSKTGRSAEFLQGQRLN